MKSDNYLGAYITEIRATIQTLKDDAVYADFKDLYSVGRIQGQVMGLELALDKLEYVYREQDN